MWWGAAACAPLEVFKVERALMIHEIGVGALPPGGFPDAVEMNHDVVAGGGLQDRLSELDGRLVVMVEEVHHHAAPAKLFERGERFFHAPAECGLMDPRPQPHLLGIRVAPNACEVKSRSEERRRRK